MTLTAEQARDWRKRNPGAALAATRRYKSSDPARSLYQDLCSKARLRGHAMELTLYDVRVLTADMRCSQTGHRLCWEWPGPEWNPWRPSIDRVDSSGGYTLDNVQCVCLIYNLCKNHWSDDVVQEFIRGANV